MEKERIFEYIGEGKGAPEPKINNSNVEGEERATEEEKEEVKNEKEDGYNYGYPESLSGGKWPYPSGGS